MNKNLKYGLITVGILVIIFVLYKLFNSSFFQDDAEQNQDAIDKGLDGLSNLDPKSDLSDDLSPDVYVRTSPDVLTSEVAEKVFTTYEAKITQMAAKIDVPLDEMLETVASIMIANLEVNDRFTQRALELYLEHLNIWLPIYMSANNSMLTSIGTISASLFNANISGQTCTETVFMKDVTEETEETQTQTVATVAVTKSKGGFLGMNKRKTTTEETVINNIATSNTVRHIQYVPHCTSWGISNSTYEANISSFALSVSTLYSFFQTVLDACPDVNLYIKRNEDVVNINS